MNQKMHTIIYPSNESMKVLYLPCQQHDYTVLYGTVGNPSTSDANLSEAV